MDPRLVQRWMDEGKLPNMKKLAAAGGGVHALETTHSPESPTAWASFATGVNAGKHNIYDFLIRDTSNYLPDLGMVHREPPRFVLNYFPVSRPKITSIRGGTSFWVTAGNAGVRSSVLTVPVTFPPEEVPNGEMLAGLPLARHPRHHGHLQLFRNRPEPLRRGQHRDGRHPEEARVRRRHRADRAGRAAQSNHQATAARAAREDAVVRVRQVQDCGARSARGRPAADVDSLESPGKVGDGRSRRQLDPPRANTSGASGSSSTSTSTCSSASTAWRRST